MKPTGDKLAMRLGGLIFSGLGFLAALPLVFVATFIANNFFWGYPGHVAVIGGSWAAFAVSVLGGLFCLVRPSQQAYLTAVGSYVLSAAVGILWFTPLARNLLH
jgi:hypothetical protein